MTSKKAGQATPNSLRDGELRKRLAMNTQIVDFRLTKIENVRSYEPDMFAVRTDRPAVWLQKLAVFVLRKLGAYAHRNDIVCRRVSIDKGKLFKALIEQRDELMRHYNERPVTVLLGPEDMNDLLGESVDDSFQWPHVKFEIDGGWSAWGMTLEVVPWMKGILVMPKPMQGLAR
jgi:hypothetical protein